MSSLSHRRGSVLRDASLAAELLPSEVEARQRRDSSGGSSHAVGSLRDSHSGGGGFGEFARSLGRSLVRSLAADRSLTALLAEEEEDGDGSDEFGQRRAGGRADGYDDEDEDVDALPSEDLDPNRGHVDLATQLAIAMQPTRVAQHSRRSSLVAGASAAADVDEVSSPLPADDAVVDAASLEALDPHVPLASPRAADAASPSSSGRAPATDEDQADEDDSEQHVAGAAAAAEFTSEAVEKQRSLALAEKLLGTKAERSAAKTREEKEQPLRSWLLAHSDASSTWSQVALGSSQHGLPPEAVPVRRAVFGTNHLSAQKPPSWYKQLFQCFFHPFNVLLTVLAGIAAGTGDFNSVVLISLMVGISVGIAFVQERRALISALALSKRITHKVRIRRPRGRDTEANGVGAVHSPPAGGGGGGGRNGYARVGSDKASASSSSSKAMEVIIAAKDGGADASAPFTVQEVPSHDLVPGDIVLLSAGSLVPADLRLLRCTQLLINQTILTGESIPAEKNARRYRPHVASSALGGGGELAGHTDSHFLRRPNMAYMGSVVESGSGVGIVLATGSNSYFGANASELQQARPPSAFAKGVKQVSLILSGFTAIMLPIVFLVNGLLKGNWTQAALFAAATAVGVTPVMLPMIVSGNLSLAAHNLAQRKCLVKRLEAVQNLGATTVLCTDKTGTLTDDHVRLHGSVCSDDSAAIRARHVAYVIAKLQQGFRNVLDRAIVEHAEESRAEQEVHERTRLEQLAQGKKVQAGQRSRANSSDSSSRYPSRSASSITVSVVPSSGSSSSSSSAAAAAVPMSSIFVPRPRLVLPPSFSYSKVTELPFDFRRRRMSICLDIQIDAPCAPSGGAGGDAVEPVSLIPPDVKSRALAAGASSVRFLFCKGAMAEMLRSCSHFRRSDADPEERTLDEAALASIKQLGERLAAKGLRVLAVAEKFIPLDGGADAKATLPTIASESGMTLLGFLTFLDTPKASAAPSIVSLAALGISAKVLTGDNPLVARQVCEQIGIDCTHVLTGDDMSALPPGDDDPSLYPLFEKTTIFSQLSPDDKARVVRVLRMGGATVAALGDGINDALMLREADVGVSVDTGADLAKEAADIILTEKDLSVLVTAVALGRRTHGNSIKYIKMAASSNFGNCFSLLIAAAWLPFLPAATLQLLTQGLLYDISQLAIPFDRMDRDWLKKPQPWSGGNLITFMLFIGPISSIFDVSTFAIAYYLYGLDTSKDDRKVSEFQTMWFLVGLTTQLLIVHMIRTERIPFIQSRAHPRLTVMTLAVGAVGLALPWIPFASKVLTMVAPPLSFFAVIGGSCFAYSLLVLIAKKFFIRRFKQWL